MTMSDDDCKCADMNAISNALGQLGGEFRVMHQSLASNLTVIRDEIHRLEDRSNQRLEQLESRLNIRLDNMGGRITALENEDKLMIEKVAKLSALGGGVGGALAAAAVEILKRM
jgi:hypothetical protein